MTPLERLKLAAELNRLREAVESGSFPASRERKRQRIEEILVLLGARPKVEPPDTSPDTMMVWAKSWIWGRKGKAADRYDMPSDKLIKQFGRYVPNKPVTLYRAQTPSDQPGELQSWTYDRDIAEAMAEDSGRELIGRMVVPAEILVDFSRMTTDAKTMLEMTWDEVVVASGPVRDRIAAVRS